MTAVVAGHPCQARGDRDHLLSPPPPRPPPPPEILMESEGSNEETHGPVTPWGTRPKAQDHRPLVFTPPLPPAPRVRSRWSPTREDRMTHTTRVGARSFGPTPIPTFEQNLRGRKETRETPNPHHPRRAKRSTHLITPSETFPSTPEQTRKDMKWCSQE